MSPAKDHATITPDEIREGDLIFCAKKSMMQSMLESVGDPWRHVGIALAVDGVLSLGEVTGGHRIASRPIEKALAFYDLVATARVTVSSHCVDSAVKWVRGHLETPQVYAWDDVILTGFLLVTRRRLPAARLPDLAAALQRVSKERPRLKGPSMTCSSFVYEAYRQSGQRCALLTPINPSAGAARRALHARAAPTNLGELAKLDQAELQDLLDQLNLVELTENIEIDSTGPKAGQVGHSKSRASLEQIYRATRTIVEIVDEYSKSYPYSSASDMDGRWVSPGDIWRSHALVDRHYLKGS